MAQTVAHKRPTLRRSHNLQRHVATTFFRPRPLVSSCGTYWKETSASKKQTYSNNRRWTWSLQVRSYIGLSEKSAVMGRQVAKNSAGRGNHLEEFFWYSQVGTEATALAHLVYDFVTNGNSRSLSMPLICFYKYIDQTFVPIERIHVSSQFSDHFLRK